MYGSGAAQNVLALDKAERSPAIGTESWNGRAGLPRAAGEMRRGRRRGG